MRMSLPSQLIVVSGLDAAAPRARRHLAENLATCHEVKTRQLLRRLLLAQRAIGGNGFIELLQALFGICNWRGCVSTVFARPCPVYSPGFGFALQWPGTKAASTLAPPVQRRMMRTAYYVWNTLGLHYADMSMTEHGATHALRCEILLRRLRRPLSCRVLHLHHRSWPSPVAEWQSFIVLLPGTEEECIPDSSRLSKLEDPSLGRVEPGSNMQETSGKQRVSALANMRSCARLCASGTRFSRCGPDLSWSFFASAS